MLSYLFDIAFVLTVILSALVVARSMTLAESALTFLAVLLASLFAISLFEPIAEWCSAKLFLATDYGVTKFLWPFFALFLFLLALAFLQQQFLRTVGETTDFGPKLESFGGWIFGGLAGYVLAAFLLTLVHTLPGPRNYWGLFEPEAHRRPGPVMAFAPDYQLLSLVDYTCVPRGALTGIQWTLGGPVATTDLRKGQWASFPVRYALWRESLAFLASDEDLVDPVEDPANRRVDAFFMDEDPADPEEDPGPPVEDPAPASEDQAPAKEDPAPAESEEDPPEGDPLDADCA